MKLQRLALFAAALWWGSLTTVGLLVVPLLFARLGSGALPFLVPLLLQVALGYSPSQAGMSMLPLAAAVATGSGAVALLAAAAAVLAVVVAWAAC